MQTQTGLEGKVKSITALHYFENQDIFQSKAQCWVNPVNTVGVSGAGLALQFKNHFPNNYKLYKAACADKLCDIGLCYLTVCDYPNFIINFPTKRHFKDPSSIDYIKLGMESLLGLIDLYKITSIALPMLGCGLGQLNKKEVMPLIIEPLWSRRGIDIHLYM